MSRGGPIDDFSWSETYAARVVSPDGDRVRGYDLEADLAANYGYAEFVAIALTGEAPTREQGTALCVAMVFLAKVKPGAVPCHAAGLSRLMGARPSAVVATACLGLMEQSRDTLDAHQPLLDWLGSDRQGPPPRLTPATDEDRASVQRLRSLLPPGIDAAIFDHDPTRLEAIIAVLYECGIAQPEQLLTVFLLSRLAPVAAEALAVPPLGFPSYPLKVPNFVYTGDEER